MCVGGGALEITFTPNPNLLPMTQGQWKDQSRRSHSLKYGFSVGILATVWFSLVTDGKRKRLDKRTCGRREKGTNCLFVKKEKRQRMATTTFSESAYNNLQEPRCLAPFTDKDRETQRKEPAAPLRRGSGCAGAEPRQGT